jgi:phage tail sheath protein FI
MPEYLAPGVYVEETSYRAKTIEGVSTTTTGFIGPTGFGPVTLDPDIIVSIGQFERVYGSGDQLTFGTDGGGELVMDNFMWHAARAFFTEGGKRLYVSRVFLPLQDDIDSKSATPGQGSATLGGVQLRARYPGAYGNFILRFTLKAGGNVLGAIKTAAGTLEPKLGDLSDRDIVWIAQRQGSPGGPPLGDLYIAERDHTPGRRIPWKFTGAAGSLIASPLTEFDVSTLNVDPTPNHGDSVRVVTLTLDVLLSDGITSVGTWSDLPIDPDHDSGGLADSLFARFGTDSDADAMPIVAIADGLSGLDVVATLFGSEPTIDFDQKEHLDKGIARQPIQLQNGNDGRRPGAGEYEGKADPDEPHKTGLKQFEAIDDISIVAAPGSTWNYNSSYRDDANAIIGILLAHAENMRYRIAIVDSAQHQTISDVRKMRAKLSSKYGALYFPWVKVLDPITRKTITLPPSGFVAGIYARNDINRAVYKAPANEVVNLALGFEMLLNKAQQDVLNPEGINCFRYFAGRGMLVWGARTISGDPEWKYVNLRRYFAYLEHSIDRGTQWAVFEPNGERLWADVRRTVEDFLLNEWQMGALLGDKPEKAFFVRCDRSTMTQNDIDNGRLVCLVGLAALTPAEFVIFRIGQWTSDRKV